MALVGLMSDFHRRGDNSRTWNTEGRVVSTDTMTARTSCAPGTTKRYTEDIGFFCH